MLRLVPDAGHAVGLHLDRDELTAVLVDLAGEVVAERRAPLALGAGAEALVGRRARRSAALRAAAAGPPSSAWGSRCPARSTTRAGCCTGSPGSPSGTGSRCGTRSRRGSGCPWSWTRTPTRPRSACHGSPGCGDSFAYLHLGTGLGAGLVLGGAPYRGPRTGAGEFGHQVIQLDGPPCGCGNRGCIEALCLAAVGRAVPSTRRARVLGEGAANLVGLLDIDLVLLGGRTVAAAEERFVEGVRAVLGERARRGGTVEVPVLSAPGSERVVVEGAAQLVLAPLFGRAHGHFPANRNDRNLS